MNGRTVFETRREPCGAQGFPEKANPNRSTAGAGSSRRTPGDAGPYPAKCNPCGQRTPLTDDQRRLVVKYLPLAEVMARKMGLPTSELDELISAAYLAVVEAAQSFDPAYAVNFATFARHRIRGALIACRRSWLRMAKRSNRARTPEFQRLDPLDETQESVLVGEPESPTSPEFEETEALESYLRQLPREQANACRLIYLDGKSQEEAADVLGYSKAYLSRLHQDALVRLRRRCS